MQTIKKEAAVVMLPSTDSKVKHIWLQPKTKELLYIPSVNSIDCIGQHLYFVTNEQIRHGDWLIFFEKNGNKIHQMHSDAGYGLKTGTKVLGYKNGTLILSWSKCRKIVATTNTELHNHNIISIPNDFIEKFVDKQGKIEFIQLIYDGYNKSTTWEYDEPEIVAIRRGNDNTCVIAPEDNKKYTVDAVQNILEDYDREFKLQTMAYTQLNRFPDSPSEWFKKKYLSNS